MSMEKLIRSKRKVGDNMIVAHSQLVKYSNDLGVDTKVITDDKKVTILKAVSLYEDLTPAQKPFESFIRRAKYTYCRNEIPSLKLGSDDTQIEKIIRTNNSIALEKFKCYYSSELIIVERIFKIFNKHDEPLGFIYLEITIRDGKFVRYNKTYDFFGIATTEDIQDKFNLKFDYNDDNKIYNIYKSKVVRWSPP